MKPKIVCLCGSTRFYKEFVEANERETLAGNIVLSIGLSGRHRLIYKKLYSKGYDTWDSILFEGDNYLVVDKSDWRLTDAQKTMLDELHLHKIDLADEIFVINVGGYVGESTSREIAYATAHEKPVRYLEK